MNKKQCNALLPLVQLLPAVAAAARMTGFTLPSFPAGVVMTISATPATLAGITSMSTVEG